MSEPDFDIIVRWWSDLENDRGGMAELRRAHNPAEVVFVPAYHRLYSQLPAVNRENLACVAGLCAHIKGASDTKLSQQMAEGKEKPRVSSLRFRRLLAIKDRTELYHAMIRVIRQLGGVANVRDLAKIVYWWNDSTKKQLAYDYYAIAKT